MRSAIIAITISAAAFGYTNFICTDAMFTDQRQFPHYAYHRAWDKKIGQSNVSMVIRAAQYYGINPLIMFATLQKESAQLTTPTRPLQDYAFGASLHQDRTRGVELYADFTRQAWIAAQCLRRAYNEWNRKRTVYIYELKAKRTTANAATYALYVYTPYWELHSMGERYGNHSLPGIITRLSLQLSNVLRK